MSFLRASASQPSPVEVSKLEARPATAPLRPNVRGAASFFGSLRSAPLYGCATPPAAQALYRPSSWPAAARLIARSCCPGRLAERVCRDATEVVLCIKRNWRAPLMQRQPWQRCCGRADVARLARATCRGSFNGAFGGILRRLLMGSFGAPETRRHRAKDPVLPAVPHLGVGPLQFTVKNVR